MNPSELTPSMTVILGEHLIEAGRPAGVVTAVPGLGQPVGATLPSHPDVGTVTVTGSTTSGAGSPPPPSSR